MARKRTIRTKLERLAGIFSPAVTALLAFMVFFQAIAVVASSSAHASADAELSLVIADFVVCNAGANGDQGNSKGRASHAACCLLCNAGANAPYPVREIGTIPARSAFPEALAPAVFSSRVPSSSHPVGWVTSWSSQAPPSHS